MANVKVLDSFALLAYFGDEPGAQVVQKLLSDAEAGRVHLTMPTINLGEVWYAIARAESIATAERLVNEVRSMPIAFVDADWTLTHEAAEFKARGGMSYADCFVAALAHIKKAEVITGDPEFRSVASDIKIVWLGNES